MNETTDAAGNCCINLGHLDVKLNLGALIINNVDTTILQRSTLLKHITSYFYFHGARYYYLDHDQNALVIVFDSFKHYANKLDAAGTIFIQLFKNAICVELNHTSNSNKSITTSTSDVLELAGTDSVEYTFKWRVSCSTT